MHVPNVLLRKENITAIFHLRLLVLIIYPSLELLLVQKSCAGGGLPIKMQGSLLLYPVCWLARCFSIPPLPLFLHGFMRVNELRTKHSCAPGIILDEGIFNAAHCRKLNSHGKKKKSKILLIDIQFRWE